MTALRVTVTNNTTATPIYKVTGALETYGALRPEHALEAGQSCRTIFALGSRGNPPIDAVPDSERARYLAERREQITVEFEMNGRRWVKQGDQSPIERQTLSPDRRTSLTRRG